MRVFAVDIETTGLNPIVHSIVEVAIVAFELGDLQAPKKLLHRYVIPEDMIWSSYCLNLHKDMLSKLLTNAIPIDKDCHLYTDFSIPKQVPESQLFKEIMVWSAQIQAEKMTACGKNFGSFDRQFIQNLPSFVEIFKHRSLDPTVDFIRPEDKFPPELKECKKRAKELGCVIDNVDVSHTAVDDCMDIMNLMQFAYLNKKWTTHLDI